MVIRVARHGHRLTPKLRAVGRMPGQSLEVDRAVAVPDCGRLAAVQPPPSEPGRLEAGRRPGAAVAEQDAAGELEVHAVTVAPAQPDPGTPVWAAITRCGCAPIR